MLLRMNLDIRKLTLGTAQFGDKYGVSRSQDTVSDREVARILRLAETAGLDLIDTAIAYGSSEEKLGRGGVAGFKVISKLAPFENNRLSARSIVKQGIRGSTERLGISNLHGLLLHEAQDWNSATVRAALLNSKAEGHCKKIGVSIYSPSDLDSLVDWQCLDVVQTPVNIFDRRLEASGWLKRLYESGIEIHARSIFLQGLLSMEHSKVPQYFDQWQPLLKAWSNWLSSSDTSAIDACIGFVSRKKEISRVVVGVETAGQLRRVLKGFAADVGPIPPSFMCDDDRLLNPSFWVIK